MAEESLGEYRSNACSCGGGYTRSEHRLQPRLRPAFAPASVAIRASPALASENHAASFLRRLRLRPDHHPPPVGVQSGRFWRKLPDAIVSLVHCFRRLAAWPSHGASAPSEPSASHGHFPSAAPAGPAVYPPRVFTASSGFIARAHGCGRGETWVREGEMRRAPVQLASFQRETNRIAGP